MGLFTPMRMSEHYELKLEEISDQNFMSKIAKKSKSAYNRDQAARYLTDQKVLAYVAKNDKDDSVRCSAVNSLTDQEALAYVAKNNSNLYVRMVAVNKLTDLETLVYIAKNNKKSNELYEDVKSLTNGKETSYQDSPVLRYWRNNEYAFLCDQVRGVAANHLSKLVNQSTDKNLLAKIARGSEQDYLYRWVEKKYRSPDIWMLDLRDEARNKLSDLNSNSSK